ncbi:MAG: hypothetical protein RL166_1100 [Actinomycetota bacterium]
MRKPGLATVGFGLIGIGSSLFAAPASAAIDCGTAPSGGTLTQSGDYCQLTYTTPGSYNFTVPSSAGQLFALVVGSGAGGYTDYPFHYAGAAGKVTYKDMSDSVGAPLSIQVGQGGTGGTDSAVATGTDSSVSAPSTSNTAVAFGGVSGGAPSDNYCTMPGWTAHLYVGPGARTSTSLAASGDSCLNGEGAGVNPSLGHPDSNGLATPSIFANLNQTFGTGGRIVRLPNVLDIPHTSGDGAGIELDITDDALSGPSRTGGNGVVILRWSEGTGLANTGSNSSDLSSVAASLITLGTAL